MVPRMIKYILAVFILLCEVIRLKSKECFSLCMPASQTYFRIAVEEVKLLNVLEGNNVEIINQCLRKQTCAYCWNDEVKYFIPNDIYSHRFVSKCMSITQQRSIKRERKTENTLTLSRGEKLFRCHLPGHWILTDKSQNYVYTYHVTVSKTQFCSVLNLFT